MKDFPRLVLLVLMSTEFGSALAVEFVDPDGLGPDAPDMLVPEKLFVTCSPLRFGVSINDPIKDPKAWDVSKIVEYPLTDKPLKATSPCQHGENIVEAELEAWPPGETGMCSAVHHVKLRLLANRKLVLYSHFANHCTGWGVTSIGVHNWRSPNKLADLTVCGYWRVPSDLIEIGGDIRTFKCEKFALDKMYDAGFPLIGPT